MSISRGCVADRWFRNVLDAGSCSIGKLEYQVLCGSSFRWLSDGFRMQQGLD